MYRFSLIQINDSQDKKRLHDTVNCMRPDGSTKELWLWLNVIPSKIWGNDLLISFAQNTGTKENGLYFAFILWVLRIDLMAMCFFTHTSGIARTELSLRTCRKYLEISSLLLKERLWKQIVSFKSSPYLGSDKVFPFRAMPMVRKRNILY